MTAVPKDPWSGFPPEVRKQLNERWARPCRAAFSWLMENDPDGLHELLESPINPIYLAMAAEAITEKTRGDKRTIDQLTMVGPLLDLLSHEHTYVREVVVNALSFLFLNYGFRLDYVEEALRKRLEVETSSELCELILEQLNLDEQP